jgi:hypothetical protein
VDQKTEESEMKRKRKSNSNGSPTAAEEQHVDLIDDELPRIARLCIANNWRRTDSHYGGWHYFTERELAEINRNTGTNFDYGYCFLDGDEAETSGLIRLCEGNANPKWSFWLEDGEVCIEWA